MAKKKQRRQAARLASARSWLPTYEGKNIVKGYRKRYGVDWPTAFRELEMLGLEFDPAYKEQALRSVREHRERQKQKKAERAMKEAMAQKRGHYCHICGRHRANEKFSGKGHPRHICKDCVRAQRQQRRARRKQADTSTDQPDR